MTDSPTALLRRAAARLRILAADADREIETNEYWHSELAARPDWYAHGIRNGLGGPAAELAAAMHPGVVEQLARWLDSAAEDAQQVGADPCAVDAACLILGQPAQQRGPLASQQPRSPTDAPEFIPTPERAAQARTGVRVFWLQRDHDVTGISGTGIVADGVEWPDRSVTIRWRGPRPSTVNWASLTDAEAIHGHGGATRIVWTDQPNDDLTEVERLGFDLYRAQDALAFVREMCDIADRNSDTITTRDVRNWLAGPKCGRQLLVGAQPDNGVDSRTDSQDNGQDSTVDTGTDSPATRADSVRTGQDSGLREQYAAAIDQLRDSGGVYSLEDFERDRIVEVVLGIRDRRMEQLAADVERQVDAKMGVAGEWGNALGDKTAAEAAITRARVECDAIEAETYTDPSEDAYGHRAAVRRIRAALGGAPAEQPTRGPLSTGPVDWATDVIPAPPTTYAEAQQRHRQLLHRRHAAVQAVMDAWDRKEAQAIRDLVRLSQTDTTKEARP
ncbi:hypothetical protein [Streptomyces sp. RTd22]|uniref:hypothetical protein n=1 Tax=Streptomyces sp. RTd22 TaxID=1841249 RepID=UPI000B2A7234|nr:hypothetical protein [Streptomyces sp. RTd22]